MEVVNEVWPGTGGQLEEFQQPGPDGPVVMVNLIKFRDRAEYEDGSDSELSGRDAYLRYAEAVLPMIEERGGRMLFVGDASFLLLGQVEELWDEVGVAEYPNRATVFEMTTSVEYQQVQHHRTAGLAGQLNIETTHSPGQTSVTAPKS